MWRVKHGSVAHCAQIVRYTLLTLIIFMLVCTSLAIILVSFASDYSTALHDRTNGIIIILLLIALNYVFGFIAVWRCYLFLLTIFALVDLFLSSVCLLSTHQGHHIGNLGAFTVFASSAILSITFIWQTNRERTMKRMASVQNAQVNYYHHVPDDWYDYGSTSTYIVADKDELMPTQLLLPYCRCDLTNDVDDETITTTNSTNNFCTVESNEPQFLEGERYAL